MATELTLVDRFGNPFKVHGTQRGAVSTAKRLPDFATLVQEGKVWRAQDTTTTALNNNAFPTTTAGLTLQNPAGTGKDYIVFAVTSICDVFEAAALITYSAALCVHNAAVVPYTRDIALTAIGSMKAGQGAYGGQAILDRGATVANDNWTPIGNTEKSILNAQTWNASYIALQVPVIVPEGLHISVAGVADTATVEAGFGFVWAEVDTEELE